MSRKYIEVALEQLIKATEDANKVIKELQNAISESCKEPKVLTVEEITESLVSRYPHLAGNTAFDELGRLMIADLFTQGKQNGRLERDLELRPLIKTIRNLYREEGEEEDPESMYLISQALDNLPPLNKR